MLKRKNSEEIYPLVKTEQTPPIPIDERKWYEKITISPWYKKHYIPRTITNPSEYYLYHQQLKTQFGTTDISSLSEEKQQTIEKERKIIIKNMQKKYTSNKIGNTKYTWYSFLPMSLFNQFKYFYNIYFLMTALSQLIPILKVGLAFTYFAPLIFVIALAMIKDGIDELRIYRRDIKLNNEEFDCLNENNQFVKTKSKDICVGSILRMKKGERVPADLVILQSLDEDGTCFIKTDQLDGETDWKLKMSLKCFQHMSNEELNNAKFDIDCEEPKNTIYNFLGRVKLYQNSNEIDTFDNNEIEIQMNDDIEANIPQQRNTKNDENTVSESNHIFSLSCENTAWANTVVASEGLVGIVIYTGKETRSSMNRSDHGSIKCGRVDLALNRLSKILFVIMVILSAIMILPDIFNGSFSSFTLVIFVRYLILFSSIIPISMKVNLDVAKLVYSFFISSDNQIPGAEVRNSSIPEELGQIQFLLSDKTGTLTKNEMTFKILSLGNQTYSSDAYEEIKEELYEFCQTDQSQRIMQKSSTERLMECIKALALCHNVTPTTTAEGERYYQASSPDEVALVEFTEKIGVVLKEKTYSLMKLDVEGHEEKYEILNIFPFSSATKRMGIIVRNKQTNIITLYMKGADSVMATLIENVEWLGEECGNLAKDGLRTLVFGKKIISEEHYELFKKEYTAASTSMVNRDELMAECVSKIERNLKMLCISGVEDQLQDDVQQSLEMLKHAGIRTWMLTGDKVETALCIAKSTRLVSVDQEVREFFANSIDEIDRLMDRYSINIEDDGLIVDGSTLSFVLKEMPDHFISFALRAKSVICCRCMPTQKAEIVELVKKSGIRTCAIGDGGNDVSMIQVADVGLGIEGKEGKQASMAADFSLKQFSHITRLLLWHGRNSYIRSSDLSLFIMHRGMIISIMQAIFSALFNFAPVALFQGYLLMGYATYYTMFPVLSLIFDERVNEEKVMEFPDLYHQLQIKQRLSMTNLFSWVFLSILQAYIVMLLCMLLFKDTFVNIVSISFTALIIIELLNIGFTIRRWNWTILSSELASVAIYFISIFCLPEYFDLEFVFNIDFWWKLILICLVSSLPLIAKFIYQIIFPPKYMTVENRRCPISFNWRCPALPNCSFISKYLPCISQDKKCCKKSDDMDYHTEIELESNNYSSSNNFNDYNTSNYSFN